MINFNTILSSYDERGTLLKWLKSLQEALEGGALETVTTTTGDDYVIFHFTFADGTSVDSPSIPLEAGPQGPQGIQGPQGVPGVDGEDGAAATVEIGTVTTLAPGADATVTNSGTSAAAVLNFGIPQGATGNPGEIIDQIVPVEATTTASRAYAVGDYFVNNLGILVKATAAIALGDTIDSTNSSAVNETLGNDLLHAIPTSKVGTVTPNGSVDSTGLLVIQYGNVITVEGYLLNVPVVANTFVHMATISGVSMPWGEIKSLGAVAVHAYEHPEDVAYINVETNGKINVVSSLTGTKAIFFAITYTI